MVHSRVPEAWRVRRVLILGTATWLLAGHGVKAEQPPQVTLSSRSEMATRPELTLARESVLADPGPDRRIVSIALDASGNVYMLDDAALEVRVISPEGVSVGTIRGAGAWVLPYNVAVARDTVLVVDGGFAPEPGARERTMVVHVTGLRPGIQGRARLRPSSQPAPRVMGTDAGWAVFGARHTRFPAVAGREVLFDSIYVARVALPGGAVERSFTSAAAPFTTDRRGLKRRPFQTFESRVTVAPDGRAYAALEDGYAIEVLDPRGAPRRRIVADVERRPVTGQEHRDYLDRTILRLQEQLELSPSAESRRVLAALQEDGEGFGRADHWPVTGALIPSRDGHLLVERPDLGTASPRGEGPTMWDLFDGNGKIAGQVRTPASITPVLLAYPLVYGFERTPAGSRVVRWRLERR